jgi:hypothetical protein
VEGVCQQDVGCEADVQNNRLVGEGFVAGFGGLFLQRARLLLFACCYRSKRAKAVGSVFLKSGSGTAFWLWTSFGWTNTPGLFADSALPSFATVPNNRSLATCAFALCDSHAPEKHTNNLEDTSFLQM